MKRERIHKHIFRLKMLVAGLIFLMAVWIFFDTFILLPRSITPGAEGLEAIFVGFASGIALAVVMAFSIIVAGVAILLLGFGVIVCIKERKYNPLAGGKAADPRRYKTCRILADVLLIVSIGVVTVYHCFITANQAVLFIGGVSVSAAAFGILIFTEVLAEIAAKQMNNEP